MDVPGACFTGTDENAAAPAEGLGAARAQQRIGHEAGMPAVAVREGMYEHERVVKARGHVVQGQRRLDAQLEGGVIQQLS